MGQQQKSQQKLRHSDPMKNQFAISIQKRGSSIVQIEDLTRFRSSSWLPGFASLMLILWTSESTEEQSVDRLNQMQSDRSILAEIQDSKNPIKQPLFAR